jgi:hypothetical protein
VRVVLREAVPDKLVIFCDLVDDGAEARDAGGDNFLVVLFPGLNNTYNSSSPRLRLSNRAPLKGANQNALKPSVARAITAGRARAKS